MQLCSGLISKFFYHSQLAGNGGSLSSVYLISLYPVMEAVVNAMSRRFRSIYCMTYLLLVLKAIVFSGGVEASTFPFQKFTCLFKTIFFVLHQTFFRDERARIRGHGGACCEAYDTHRLPSSRDSSASGLVISQYSNYPYYED